MKLQQQWFVLCYNEGEPIENSGSPDCVPDKSFVFIMEAEPEDQTYAKATEYLTKYFGNVLQDFDAFRVWDTLDWINVKNPILLN